MIVAKSKEERGFDLARLQVGDHFARHDAFDNPANAACRESNLRVPREAAQTALCRV